MSNLRACDGQSTPAYDIPVPSIVRPEPTRSSASASTCPLCQIPAPDQ
jgi:hypothetical protein